MKKLSTLVCLLLVCFTSIGWKQVGGWYSPFTSGTGTTSISDTDWTRHNNYPAACPEGQYVTQIGDTLTCSTPTDNNTTYTAGGTLLDLTGTTFSIDEGTLTNGKLCTYVSGTGLVCNTDPSGGATSPGGSSGQVQFNDSGTFNGTAALTVSGSTLTMGGTLNASTGTLVLPSSGTASFTEGELKWEPSVDKLYIGTGSGTISLVERKAAVTFVFSGGGQAITTSGSTFFEVPLNNDITISAWELMGGGETGSATFDLQRATGTSYPLSYSDIDGSAPISVSGATGAYSTTLTGWTTTLNRTDKLKLILSSSSTFEQITVNLYD